MENTQYGNNDKPNESNESNEPKHMVKLRQYASQLELEIINNKKSERDLEYIARLMHMAGTTVIIDESIYKYDYNKGYYIKQSDKNQALIIVKIYNDMIRTLNDNNKKQLKGKLKRTEQNEILQYYLADEEFQRDQEELNPPGIINHINGLVNINEYTGEIIMLDHTPLYITTHQIPFKYNDKLTEKDHPVFNKDIAFICQSINKNGLYERDDFKEGAIKELMAAGFVGGMLESHVYYVIYGSGGNGKSTITRYLRYLTTGDLPLRGKERTIKPFKLRDLVGMPNERDKWAITHLIDAKCIIDDDVGEIRFPKMTLFNSIITGEIQKIDRKYMNSIEKEFKGTAILLTTEFPKIKAEAADLRRIQVIKFEHEFKSRENQTQDGNDKSGNKKSNEKPRQLKYYTRWYGEAEAIIATLYRTMSEMIKHGDIKFRYDYNYIMDTIQDATDDPLNEIIQNTFERDIGGKMKFADIITIIKQRFEELYPLEFEDLIKTYCNNTKVGRVPLIQHAKYRMRLIGKTPQVFYRLNIKGESENE